MQSEEYNKIINQLQEGFLKYKGKGYCYLYKPIEVSKIIVHLIKKMIDKRNDIKILIALEDYSQKEEIKEAFSIFDEESVFYYNHLKFISHSYLKLVKDEQFCFISIGINDDEEMLIKNVNNSKFSLLIFTKTILGKDFINKIESVTNFINLDINAQKIIHRKIYSLVEEYRYGVTLNDEDKTLYKKYDDYIRDSISIFGDLQVIDYCRRGNPYTNASALDCCYTLARQNGWDSNLDMSIEYNKQLDAIFNPIAIKERVNTIFNITSLRKKLVTDNNAKLETIKNIVLNNPNKKIIIVCVRGEFANTVVSYLNENNISALGYHNELEDSYLKDNNGELICYKSGENKGKPKIFKWSALSNNNLQFYNANLVNVLCIKGSSSNELECNVDIIIYTSPLLDDIFSFKTRFNNINFKTPTIVHKLYCIDTNEEKQMYKEKENSLIKIHNEDLTQNLKIDEFSGDIIL